MAQSEEPTTLPRLESPQLTAPLAQAPPALDAISGSTPEGQDQSQSNPQESTISTPWADPTTLNAGRAIDSLSQPPTSVSSTPNGMNPLGSSEKPSVSDQGPQSLSGHVDSAPTTSKLAHPFSGQPPLQAGTTTPTSMSSNPPTPVEPASHAAAASPSPVPTKRVAAVKPMNVNRMFLGKTATTAAPAAPAPSGVKSTTTPQSQTQPTPPHSRLVTAKLTGIAQTSASPTAVWKSPSSSVPSTSASTPALQHAQPNFSAPIGSSTTKPGPPTKPSSSHPGKVWSANSGPPSAILPNGAAREFPTAAEVANIKKAKEEAAAAAVLDAAALKLQQAATADAFRGMHLDPKAHHWDDDEDEDDFLNEVIEFGDGTQYTVKHEDPLPPAGTAPASLPPQEEPSDHISTTPVRKEDRFGADIGRQWPPAPKPVSDAPDSSNLPSTSPSEGPGRPPLGVKTLFNERSNRYEQANSYRPGQSPSDARPPPPPKSVWTRRESQTENQNNGAPRWQHDRTAPAPGNQRRQSFASEDATVSPVQRTSSTLTSNGRNGGISPSDPYGGNALGLARHNRSRGPSFTDHPPDLRGSRYDNKAQSGPDVRAPSRESVRENGASHSRPPQGQMMPPPTIPAHAQRRPSRTNREMPPPSFIPNHKAAPPSSQGSDTPTSQAAIISPARSPVLSMKSPRPLPNNLLPPSSSVAPPPDPYALKAPTLSDIESFSMQSMQSAAERARERKRLEEEQREKEKERAKKKAEELAAAAEAKAAAKRAADADAAAAIAAKAKAEADAAAEALVREEEARLATATVVNSLPPKPVVAEHPASASAESSASPVWRVRSSRGSKRGAVEPPPPVPSQSSQKLDASGPKSATTPQQVGPTPAAPSSRPKPSWANVVKVPDSAPSPVVERPQAAPRVAIMHNDSWRKTGAPPPPQPPKVIPSVFDVPSEDHDALELFDFTDMHKLVEEAPPLEGAKVAGEQDPLNTARPEAPASSLPLHADHSPPSRHHAEPERPSVGPRPSTQARAPSLTATSPRTHPISPVLSTKGLMSPQALASLPLPPFKTHARESAMSALEQTMSRIKGAISNMRPGESAASIDAALAAASQARKAENDEFAVTQRPRPSSPPPLGRSPHVHIPRRWTKVQSIDSRLLYLWKLPPRPVRLDILSWDPPVEGMSRKTLSRDEVLFGAGSERIAVALPSASSYKATPAVARVNLPTSKPARRALRRPEVSVSITEALDVVSRDPTPMSPPQPSKTSLPPSTPPRQTRSAVDVSPPPLSSVSSVASIKGKARPSVGSGGVAFSKRIHGATDSVSSVSFTVNSELEDETAASEPSPSKPEVENSPKAPLGQTTKNDSTSTSQPVIPPTKPTPWTKSPLVFQTLEISPQSAADPENIKSIWETNNKNVTAAENSLKGISDELPSFSLQEVKSDDGDEPKSPKPSSPAPTAPPRRAPMRMSVMDAHRAFQMVPQPPPGAPEVKSPNYGPIEPPTPKEPQQEPRPTAPQTTPQHPSHRGPIHRPSYPPFPTPGTPMMYAQQAYGVAPIGVQPPRGPLQNGLTPTQGAPPTHMWMQVNAAPAYYRPYPQAAMMYPSPSTPTAPGSFSPTPGPQPALQVNGNKPVVNGRGPQSRPTNGAGPSMAANNNAARGMSPAPGALAYGTPGRMTPAYYTPTVQPTSLPPMATYPSSPVPHYTPPLSTHSSGSTGHSSAIYSSAPHPAYRPTPPSW
ncbi:hypothetical protein DL93DRAFT_2229326 [Clavulina sp. PMI_390]|nr:hypothetical protein DL93DRAFT_2229326 [Clavulina sp. PMI_390]